MVSFSRHKRTTADTQSGEHPVTLPMPGANLQNAQIEQIDFSEASIQSAVDFQSPQQEFPTAIPSTPLASGSFTRQPNALMLNEAHSYSLLSTHEADEIDVVITGKMPAISNKNTTSLRTPVVIPGSIRKSHALRPPKPDGKRMGLHIAVSVALVFIVGLTLMAVLPAGANGLTNFAAFSSKMNMSGSKNNNIGSVAAVAATATAVTVDGFDQTSQISQPKNTGSTVNTTNTTYAGVANVTISGATGDNFSAGQCTYWADYRYHQMTGYWVPWGGNAWQWYGGAISSGWMTSTQPRVPSIVVLAPGVQGASYGYGHVAVAEKINADGSVLTSDWNWAGNWGRTTYVTFYPGSGVHFVWHP